MPEKKQIVYDLMLKYSGPMSVEDFYKEVAVWANEKGFEKELKRKSEDIMQKGKKVEYVVELWKNPIGEVKQMIRLRALFDNFREVKARRKGNLIRFNEADAFINIDGWLETIFANRWTTNPMYTFLRNLYDKYIWGIGGDVADKYEHPVHNDCYDLHKRLRSFFELYKKRVM